MVGGAFSQKIKIAQHGEQLAPKIRRMYWYWRFWLSSNHRKRKADWSYLRIAICMNMLLTSARTPMACSRKRRICSCKTAKRSSPVRRQVLREQPLNIEAAFATRRICRYRGILYVEVEEIVGRFR